MMAVAQRVMAGRVGAEPLVMHRDNLIEAGDARTRLMTACFNDNDATSTLCPCGFRPRVLARQCR